MIPRLLKATVLLFVAVAVTPGLCADAPQQAASSDVKVQNDRLSVNLRDAEFGKVMSEIGQKAGFEVRVSREISSRKLSTVFEDMTLERGIYRLLSLINQKTYFIHYGPEGSIQKMEIFSTAETRGAQRPARKPWQPPAGPTPPRPRMPRGAQTVPAEPFMEPGSDVEPPEPIMEPDLETAPPFGEDTGPVTEQPEAPFQAEPESAEEPSEDAPTAPQKPAYIPPKKAPAFIPPSRNLR